MEKTYIIISIREDTRSISVLNMAYLTELVDMRILEAKTVGK